MAIPSASKNRDSRAGADADPSAEKERPIAEIATGIVIFLILVFMGLPKVLHWWTNLQITDDVVTLHDNMVMAQNTAVKGRNPVYVSFFPDKNTYSVHEDKNNNGKVDAEEFHQEFDLGEHLQYGTGHIEELKDVWTGNPVGEGAVQLFHGGHRLAFNAMGQTDDNGVVYLIPKQDAGRTVQNMRALKFMKTTGEIRILEYTGQGAVPWK